MKESRKEENGEEKGRAKREGKVCKGERGKER